MTCDRAHFGVGRCHMGVTPKGGRSPITSIEAPCFYVWGLATGTRLREYVLNERIYLPDERCWDTPNCKDNQNISVQMRGVFI
jgi:hypothetical protein